MKAGLLALLPYVKPVLVLVGGGLGGYIAGAVTARIVVGMLRRNLGRLLEETEVGRALSQLGVDIFAVIGGLVKAFIFSTALLAAVEQIGVKSLTWRLILDFAAYLPRLVGGIAVLLLGLVLASALSRYTGRVLRSVIREDSLTRMLETMLVLSLIVVVITIALNLMLLQGDVFYPLMLGVIIMGVGVYMGDLLVDSLVRRHAEFERVAAYAKFTIYLLFVTTGLAAIFARFRGVSLTITILAFGVVVAIAATLLPPAYRLLRAGSRD